MQIVFDDKVAKELHERYTVLELETFTVQDTNLTAYCVVPAEKLITIDLSQLETQKNNHKEFLTALQEKEWGKIVDMYDAVRGTFGGELDSFYSEIVSRANLFLGD